MYWGLIYDDNNVIDLRIINGATFIDETLNEKLFTSSTQEECFNKIDELQLTYYSVSGDTETVILFSGGTRTILEQE